MEARVDALERELTGVQAELGRLGNEQGANQSAVRDQLVGHVTAMNLVVNEAKMEFERVKAEQQAVVEGARVQFDGIAQAMATIQTGCATLAQEMTGSSEAIKKVIQDVATGQGIVIGQLTARIDLMEQQQQGSKGSGTGGGAKMKGFLSEKDGQPK